jgi:hypothetical protein
MEKSIKNKNIYPLFNPMLKLTFKEKIILVIVMIGLILGSSESFVSCIPGVFSHMQVQVQVHNNIGYSAVFSLETGVAGLQAYIYALLGCLYLQENVSPRVFSMNLKEKFLKLISKPVQI